MVTNVAVSDVAVFGFAVGLMLRMKSRSGAQPRTISEAFFASSMPAYFARQNTFVNAISYTKRTENRVE